VPYDLLTCTSIDTLYIVSDEHTFLLQRVQPAMVGLIDGSLSTLAPIFAVAVVGFELLMLAYFRYRFFQDTFIRALAIVTFAGVLIVAISAGLGSLLGKPIGG